MISWRRLFVWVGGGVGALCVAVAILLAIGLYTPFGHAAIARLVRPLTGGTVAVYGLSGNLPDHLRIARFELRDVRGAWLRLDNLVLDWDAFAIVSNHIDAARVHAAHGAILRLPVSQGKGAPPTLDITDLSVGRLDLGPAASGRPAALTISGSLDYRSSDDARVKLAATRLDDFGRYRLDGDVTNGMVAGSVDIAERDNGLLGDMAGLPGLGAVTLHARATIVGRRNSLALSATAGPLRATASGVFDMTARSGDLTFALDAPAMQPRREVAWQMLSAAGSMHGSFDRPDVHATLDIGNGSAFGFSAEDLHFEVSGTAGTVGVAGAAGHLAIPGSRPDLFAANPVSLSAELDLLAKSRPLRFTVEHPLLEMRGTATMAGTKKADAMVHLPSLAAFAPLVGVGLGGSATFHTQLSEPQPGNILARLHGDIAPSGSDLVARMLGSSAAVTLAAAMSDGGLQSAHGDLKGGSLSAQFQGVGGSRLNYAWRIAVADLSRIAAGITGSLQLGGSLTGPLSDLSAKASGSADLGTKTLPKQRIALEANATGLPKAKSGELHVSGQFAGGPVTLAAKLSHAAGGMRISIQRGAWKSAQLSGALIVANATSMQGVLALHMTQLADLSPLVGPISGAVEARMTVAPGSGAVVMTPHVVLKQPRYGSIAANQIDISGKVKGISGPVPDLKATVSGLSSGSVGGNAELAVNGPLDNLALKLSSQLSANGQPVTVAATASANSGVRRVRLEKLNASWQHHALALTAPCWIDLADGVAIDRLRAKIGTGSLELAGAITPKLALTASLAGITPEMVQPLLPLALDGTFSATATLSGTLAAPAGDIRIQGRNIRMQAAGSSVPASSLEAHGLLQGDAIAVDANLSGGKAVQLVVNGRMPLTSAKPVAIAAKGTADLAILAAPLAATGQNLKGTASIDARLGGTWAAPRATGSLEIANGEFQDYTRGIRLTNLRGRLEAQGTSIRVTNISATAGSGSLTASGTIDLAAPGIPVNIAIEARNARPVASDLLSAVLETDLKLTGKFNGRLVLGGDVKVLKAEINVPEKYPPSVAQIDIRRAVGGAASPPPPAREIALDLTLSSPGQVFVRGRGLDAEFSGTLRIRGTSAAPQVLGALEMRRGTFTLAGTTLDFQSGKIGFDGASLRNRLDPTLDFVAQTSSGGVTATLNLSGYASAPKVQLTSSPSLPQDEIMAHLLFQQSATQLSALQIAEIADAVASLSGMGSGLNPVASLRASLGLDRLAVSSASTPSGGTGATIEAGKYISRNIYLGTTQNVSGGTRAVVQLDITKHLKAQAAVGTNIHAANTSPVTPAQDTGDSVGLMYQFEY